MTRIIAHRGGAGLYVENTLAAFQNAIMLGCDAAELDVRLSKDGQVIVHHDGEFDARLCRKKDGDWIDVEERLTLSSMTMSQISEFEIGEPNPHSDYRSRFPRLTGAAGQHVPTLSEVIRLAKRSSETFELVIEIKASLFRRSRNLARILADSVLETVRETDFAHRTVFCGFDWRSVLYLKSRAPDIRVWLNVYPASWYRESGPRLGEPVPQPGFLKKLRAARRAGKIPWYAGHAPENHDDSLARAAASAGGDGLVVYQTNFSRKLARQCHDHGISVNVWTAKLADSATLGGVLQQQPSSIIIDYPDVVLSSDTQ